MSASNITVFDKVHSLSESMFAACKSADWNQLAQLESQRSTLMFQVFDNSDAPVAASQGIRAMIEMVLNVDKEIMAICAAEAEDCKVELATFSQGRKAVAAYTTTSN